MTRSRPLGVTILAVLAAIGAIIAVVHTLQMLHLFPIRGPFGQFAFFTFDLLGAILWGVMALIYIWVVRMLWNLDPQGWLFVAALSALNLVLAVISIIGQSTWQAMLPAIVVNGLILVYCLLPGTKEAFGVSPGAAPAAAAPPPAPKVAESKAAPAPAAVEAKEVGAAPEMAAAVAVEEASAAPAAEAAAEVEEVIATPAEESVVDAGEVAAALEVETAAETVEEAVEETEDKMMVTGAAALTRDLSYVEGIGEVYTGKLKEAGVETPQALLERGATPKGRSDLAEATGISGHLILRWVNQVDLYRIKGLGQQYSELLEAAGVDTVPELAQRNPQNLYEKIVEVNSEKHLVRHVPSQAQVEDWVKQAKALPRVLTY